MVGFAFLTWMAAGALPAQAAPPPVPPSTETAVEAVQFERLRYRDRVEKDGRHLHTVDVQVRLRTAQAVADFGQIGAPYVDGYAEVQFEEVVIEKTDGRRVAVTNGLVEDVSPWGVTSSSSAADVRYKKMTIPGLEPGSRLSYRLTVDAKPLAPGRVFGEIQFPALVAPLHTYELDLPRDLAMTVRLRKGLGEWAEVPSPANRLVRRLSLDKVRDEGAGSTKDEPDVAFTSFASWGEVASWWWAIARDRLTPDAAVAKEALALTAPTQAHREKLAALHAFLTGRIRYVNVSFGLGRMQPRLATEVLANRYGDCKDKHALLAAMAGSLGIDVRPVLINSERADLQDEVPSPRQFDHLISVARLGPSPEDWLWLDGTNPFGGPGYLLPNLRDKRALLVEADGQATLVRTPKDPPFVPRQEMTVKGTLRPDGVMRARVTWRLRSDGEIPIRAWLAATPHEQRGAGIGAGIARVWGGGPVENVLVSDPQDAASPLLIEFDAEKTVEAKGGERTLWVPFSGFGLAHPWPSPPGTPAVTFGLREMEERAEIEIPEGQSARAPLSVTLSRPFGTFRSTYRLEGRTLKLERTLTLSQPSLPEADVASYEAFRSAIGTDHNQAFTVLGVVTAPAVATAQSLHAEGLVAFNNKDFAKAAELFTRAGEADPKEGDIFVDLGRSLIDQRKLAESVTAFTRQIEITAFHEMAYAWRAYSRGELGDEAGAESDYRKQIEVTPFKAWSYMKLGKRKLEDGEFEEAAALLSRAATLEPKEASRWLDLADAQANSGLRDEAHQSLALAMALALPDTSKMRAAEIYHSIGEAAPAGRLAAEALPSLTSRLAKLTPESFGPRERRWATRLVEAWRYVGLAAAAAGEMEKAERYLLAAWRLGLDPEAGWALGELREKQGQLEDAVELWSMASTVRTGWSRLPGDRQRRIEVASAKLPEVAPSPSRSSMSGGAGDLVYGYSDRQTRAEARLLNLRTLRLHGPGGADLEEEVLVLADAGGLVERILNLSRRAPEAFEKQLAQLEPIRLDWSRPDEQPYKAIRGGRLSCSIASGCVLLLDMPGPAGTSSYTVGSIRIKQREPSSESALARGQKVDLSVTASYRIPMDGASVSLVVQDQDRRQLADTVVRTGLPRGAGEALLTTTFTVPKDATRILVLMPLTLAGQSTPEARMSYEVR